jgi:hypothetical protein
LENSIKPSPQTVSRNGAEVSLMDSDMGTVEEIAGSRMSDIRAKL